MKRWEFASFSKPCFPPVTISLCLDGPQLSFSFPSFLCTMQVDGLHSKKCFNKYLSDTGPECIDVKVSIDCMVGTIEASIYIKCLIPQIIKLLSNI